MDQIWCFSQKHPIQAEALFTLYRRYVWNNTCMRIVTCFPSHQYLSGIHKYESAFMLKCCEGMDFAESAAAATSCLVLISLDVLYLLNYSSISSL